MAKKKTPPTQEPAKVGPPFRKGGPTTKRLLGFTDDEWNALAAVAARNTITRPALLRKLCGLDPESASMAAALRLDVKHELEKREKRTR